MGPYEDEWRIQAFDAQGVEVRTWTRGSFQAAAAVADGIMRLAAKGHEILHSVTRVEVVHTSDLSDLVYVVGAPKPEPERIEATYSFPDRPVLPFTPLQKAILFLSVVPLGFVAEMGKAVAEARKDRERSWPRDAFIIAGVAPAAFLFWAWGKWEAVQNGRKP